VLRRIEIRNYKSIGEVAVELGPLTVLVGRNAAGKSNFLDALAFVRDCLADSVELAFKNRGGIAAVRRSSGGHPYNIEIRLIMDLDDGVTADYAYTIRARPREGFQVARERCIVRRVLDEEVRFEVQDGTFTVGIPGINPRLSKDRLALFAASATDDFRPVYDFLTSMQFYSIAPLKLREYQDADEGQVLKRDGSNAAALLKRLVDDSEHTARYERVTGLLARAVEGIVGVEHASVGHQETIRFRQDIGTKSPWRFDALNMSDGTLRLLGLLLAMYQPSDPPVVAVEEPESTVHPAITELIVQMLMEASRERQVLITTHSPEILDFEDLPDEAIKIVVSHQNSTVIAPLSEFGRQAIRDGLYTPGELLRINELNPDLTTAQQLSEQLNLFGRPFGEVRAPA